MAYPVKVGSGHIATDGEMLESKEHVAADASILRERRRSIADGFALRYRQIEWHL
jgi:hypothetical protein